MQLFKKTAVAIVSAVCAFSALPLCTNAASYTYTRANYWYYSDDTSFRFSDFGADENGNYLDGTSVDFYGLTPAGIYESGKTSYTVTFNIGGDDMDFNVKIGKAGDADMDGFVNIRDASLIARNAAETDNKYSSDFEIFLADADSDGTTSVKDASRIARNASAEAAKKAEVELQIKKERLNRVVELVNIERAKVGLKALEIDENVSKVSAKRSIEISKYFSHTRPDGSPWSTLLLAQCNVDFCYAGENIAAGYDTPEAVVQGWMDSPGHKANILDPNFTKIGVGYYYDSSSEYGHYWAQTFIQS